MVWSVPTEPMAVAHKVVTSFGADAAANASRQSSELRDKVRDVLTKARVPLANPDLISDVIAQRRRDVIEAMHVSINMPLDRLMAFISSGILSPTEPSDIASKQFRRNAESCFGADSPVYGALNIGSEVGGAPLFGAHAWLRPFNGLIRDRVTFTARDSYSIVLPFLPSFTQIKGTAALRQEVYTWDTVPELVLNRFWARQDLRQYIEAQIWGPVLLSDVEAFNVHRHVETMFINEVNRHLNALKINILSKLIVFG